MSMKIQNIFLGLWVNPKNKSKKNEEKKNPEDKEWVEFSAKDMEQQVKSLQGKTIAFRVRIEFSIKVDGRG